MNKPVEGFANLIAASILLGASCAHADVFSLGQVSTLDLAGTLSLKVDVSSPSGNGSLSGSGDFVPAKPGSLHSDLVGSLNASSDGSTLTFLGGGAITLANPDALAFTADIPLSGSVSGLSVKMTGKIHDVVFDIKGAAPLSGAPGSQTFETAGLEFFTLAGTFDGTLTPCTPTCMAPTIFSIPLADPTDPDTLPNGTGSFTTPGGKPTISLPISIPGDETQTNTQQIPPNITVTTTVDLTGSLAGNITAAVPEPSTWMLLAVGVAALFWSRRRVLTGRDYLKAPAPRRSGLGSHR